MNSLKRQKEEKTDAKCSKEIDDDMISGALSQLSKAKEKNGR
jgi:hypothetical protein